MKRRGNRRGIARRTWVEVIERLEVRMLLSGGDQGFDFPGEIAPAYPAGTNPYSVAAADLNGDGKVDLAIANNVASGTVSVLRNLGNGTFAPPVAYAVGSNPYRVIATDVNGDGKVDVVTVNGGTAPDYGGTISVLRNLGDGTFAPQVTYAVGNYPTGLVAADVNGDGKIDLVTANYLSNTISVLLNAGDGTFAPQLTYPVGTSPWSVAAADLNGDGMVDVVTSNHDSGNVSVLMNLGDGTFAPHVDYSVGGNPFAAVVAADVNGDGKPDLMTNNVGSNGVGSVSVLLNQGDGTFAPQVTYAVGSSPNWMVAADVNGDGKVDLVTANGSSGSGGSVSVLLGRGDGTFAPQATYAASNIIASAVTAADVYGDGSLDLVTANLATAGTVSVLRNLGNGTFAPQVTSVADSKAYAVTTADVNGDGRADLVTANYDLNNVAVLQNLGDGTFAAPVRYAVGNHPSAVAAADLNGDGKIDLVTANNGSGTVSVLLNRGDGTFAPQVSYRVGDSPSAVAVADVNGDGKLDLVTANYSTVSVLRNLGDGTFAPQVTYDAGGSAVIAVDVNGDGKVDLVSTNSDYNSVAVLRNLGDGTFAPKVTYNVGGVPKSVTAADINGDGKKDVVTANYNTGTVSVLRNLGNGTFAPHVDYVVGSNPVSVTAADVNGDGKMDVVTANYNSGDISVLTNLGDGTFAAQIKYAVGSNPNSVTTADLNGDGKMAVVTANYGSSTLSILRRLGPAMFTVGSNPAYVAAADLNGDGKIDLVTANENSKTISVLRNVGTETFAAQVTYGVGNYPDDVVAADINGDGKPDLLVGYQYGNANMASVLLNRGDGTFAAPVTVPLGGTANDFRRFAVSDVNGDGRADLITSSYNDDTVSVLRSLGDGTFAAPVIYAVGHNPNSVTAADLNGDGKVDLATANYDSGTVSVLLNLGDGTFAPQITYAVGSGPYSIMAGDVDGDGKADLIVGTNQAVAALRNLGDGTFTSPVVTAMGKDYFYFATAADVNGDGKADLLGNDGVITLLRGVGDGAFAAPVIYAAGSGPRHIAVADVNGDGKMDLVVANGASATGSVSILYNRALSRPVVVAGTNDGDQIVIASDGTYTTYSVDGVSNTIAKSYLSTFTINEGNGHNTIAIDLSHGNPFPNGLTVNGGAGVDELIFTGVRGEQVLGALPLSIGGATITYSGVEKIGFADGSVSIASLPAGVGLVAMGSANVTITQSMTLASLDIDGGASVSLSGGDGKVLRVNGPVTISTPATKGSGFVGLNLNDNDMIVQTANPAGRNQMLTYLTGLIGQARAKNAAGKMWQGDGITTSAGSSEDSGLTGLAVLANAVFDAVQQKEVAIYPTWQGQGVDMNSILVKYTWNGDVNVDGLVNFDDYFRINTGFLSNGALGGYQNGDLNFDKIINFDDYFMINSAFLGQGSTTMSAPAAAVSRPAVRRKIGHGLHGRSRGPRNSPRITRMNTD